MSNHQDHDVRLHGRMLTHAFTSDPRAAPPIDRPAPEAKSGPARRTVIAALAVAPAAFLGQRSVAAASDLDTAVIAKTDQVRTLLTEAHAAGAAWSERHAIHARAIEALGPKPHLDKNRLNKLAGDVLVAFGELTEDVQAVVLQMRQTLEARVEREAAAWSAECEAIAARLGIREADERDEAARLAGDQAMLELAAMPAATPHGITAKASIFQPPFAPFNDENFVHLELAGSILRDLSRQASRPNEMTAASSARDPAVVSEPDPLPAMWSEVRVIRASAGKVSQEAFDKGFERVCDLDRRACSQTRATTIPGAIASLEWARSELVEHYLDGAGDAGERLILSLMDASLDVLRRAA